LYFFEVVIERLRPALGKTMSSNQSCGGTNYKEKTFGCQRKPGRTKGPDRACRFSVGEFGGKRKGCSKTTGSCKMPAKTSQGADRADSSAMKGFIGWLPRRSVTRDSLVGLSVLVIAAAGLIRLFRRYAEDRTDSLIRKTGIKYLW